MTQVYEDIPSSSSAKIAASENLSFAAFIRQRNVVLSTPTGKFLARLKTLLSVHGPGDFSCWAGVFRWADRRARIPRDDMMHLRLLWQTYKGDRVNV